MKKPCKIWPKSKNPSGYGMAWDPETKRYWAAHRLAWHRERGPIPPGMNVLHACDVRSCVQVEHLFLGTQRDNIHDCMRKRRFTVGERSHHAKLNNDQAREIRERCHAGERYGSLAQEFGVTYETILLIAKARIWRHLDATPPTPVYEPPRPHRWCGPIIKAMYDSGYTQAALAVMFGCDQTIISDVLVEPFK